MRLLVQRVLQGQVDCLKQGCLVHSAGIGRGFVVLAGFGEADTPALPTSLIWHGMIDKLLGLRVFPDHADKMNIALSDMLAATPPDGNSGTKTGAANTAIDTPLCGMVHTQNTPPDGLLLVSQFTLYADCRKGRRPSFQRAAVPATAELLFERLKTDLALRLGTRLQCGIFGADMRVSLVNWGPVTVLLDSAELYGQ